MKDIITTIKTIFTQPTKFFKSITKEKSIKDALILYLIFLAIGFVFSIIQSTVSENLVTIPLASLEVIGTLGFLFLGALIIHGFFRLMQGSGKFKDTFNLIVYTAVPVLIIGVLADILLTIGLVGSGTVLTLVGIINGTLILIGIIWDSVLMIIGGSLVHKISKGKAAIAGIVLPLVLFIIIAMIIMLFVFLIIGAGAFAAGL